MSGAAGGQYTGFPDIFQTSWIRGIHLERHNDSALTGRGMVEHVSVAGPRAGPMQEPPVQRAFEAIGPHEPFELGRALYHLGQRRGYRSNRREDRKLRDEKKGKQKQASAEDEDQRVLGEIAGLETDFAGSGARTLGEFLSR